MIKIVKGTQIESKSEDRVVWVYQVELFNALNLEFLIFIDGNGDIILPRVKHINVTDSELYRDIRLMLERRFLRDITLK